MQQNILSLMQSNKGELDLAIVRDLLVLLVADVGLDVDLDCRD